MKKDHFIFFLIMFFLEISGMQKYASRSFPVDNSSLEPFNINQSQEAYLNNNNINNSINKNIDNIELLLAELVNIYLFTIENFGLSLRFLRLNFEKEAENLIKHKEFQKYLQTVKILHEGLFKHLQEFFNHNLNQNNFNMREMLNKNTNINFLNKKYEKTYLEFLKLFKETEINKLVFNKMPIKKVNNFLCVQMNENVKISKINKNNFIEKNYLGPLGDIDFFKDLYFAYFIKMILKDKGKSSDFFNILKNFLNSEIKKNIFYINEPLEKNNNKLLIEKLMGGPILAGAYNFIFLLKIMEKLNFDSEIIKIFKTLDLSKKSNLRKFGEYAFTGAAIGGAVYMTLPYISAMFPALASVGVPTLGTVSLGANILSKITNIGSGFLSGGSSLDKLSGLTNILNMPIIAPTQKIFKILCKKSGEGIFNKIFNNQIGEMIFSSTVSPYINTALKKLSGGKLDKFLEYESFQKMITDPLLNKIFSKKEYFKCYIQKPAIKGFYFDIIKDLEKLNRASDSSTFNKVITTKDIAFNMWSSYIGRASHIKQQVKYNNHKKLTIKDIDNIAFKKAEEGIAQDFMYQGGAQLLSHGAQRLQQSQRL